MALERKTQNAKLKTQNKFGRIGVLMGGPSSEREVSLKSGKAVYEALVHLGLDTAAIDIKTDTKEENINLIKSHRINCAFLALHGRFGEDGQIQEVLEKLKIPYTGSGVDASRLAMDKIASRRIFETNNLRVPKYEVLDKVSHTLNLRVPRDLGLPLVIKPASCGSSIGLSIINKEEELEKAAAYAFMFDEKIIIEEYISGRELTVGILDNSALPIIEIIPEKMFFDYEAKYQSALTRYVVPAELGEGLAEDIRTAAQEAHKLLGCRGCSRVDIILGRQDLPFILEVNTIPGLTNTSLLPKAARQAGIEFSRLCFKLIELAYASWPGSGVDSNNEGCGI